MKAIRAIPRATRILRSVMVAGAGTAIWMALSATAASADSGISDKHSLLGGASSSVSSAVSSATGSVKNVTAQANKTVAATTGTLKDTRASVAKVAAPKPSSTSISVPIPEVPLPAPIKAVVPSKPVTVQVPVVTPVVKQIAMSTDHVVATVPVVNRIVPQDPVRSAVETVVVPVTDTVDDTVEVVVPPVNDALKPVGLEPVTDVTNPAVQPIVDVVDTVLPPVGTVLPPVGNVLPPATGAGSLIPPALGGSATALPVQPSVGAKPSSGVVPPAAVLASALAAADAAGSGSDDAPLDTTPPALKNHVSPVLLMSRSLADGPTGSVTGASIATDSDVPAEVPGYPDVAPLGVTGAGSGSSQNAPPSPAAAFLNGSMIAPAGLLSGPASASNEQHPKPVSFDPGSSPD